jgi:hypothetical protein
MDDIVMNDIITGATTEVEVLVADLAPEQVWGLVTDVARIGEWSPECAGANWLDRPDGTAVIVPQIGDRFQGHNKFPNGFTATVECVVTQAFRPQVFEWVVLDPDGVVDRPGSIWRYDLRPAGAGTRLTHTFTHGPGLTGVREGAMLQPDRAPDVIADRLAVLHRNMTQTVHAMTRTAMAR